MSGWPSPRNSSLRPEGSPAAMAMAAAGQQTPARRCRAPPRCGFRVVEILSGEGGSGPAAGAEGEGLLQHGQWMPWSTLQQPFPQRHAPLQDGAHHHDGHAGPDRLRKEEVSNHLPTYSTSWAPAEPGAGLLSLGLRLRPRGLHRPVRAPPHGRAEPSCERLSGARSCVLKRAPWSVVRRVNGGGECGASRGEGAAEVIPDGPPRHPLR